MQVTDRAMAKKNPDTAPIRDECGGQMAHLTTLPTVNDQPSLTIFGCEHCGASAIKTKAQK